MLKQHVCHSDRPIVFHEPGEVVLADFGNYLEAGADCRRKARPVILLRPSLCQHAFAGLTTKPQYLTTGDARPVVPAAASMGLDGKTSHLWSSRPSYVSRLDVRKHLGWVDHEVVDFLARHMHLDAITLGMLWRSASAHGCGSPRRPR